jgi:hypothetical protein
MFDLETLKRVNKDAAERESRRSGKPVPTDWDEAPAKDDVVVRTTPFYACSNGTPGCDGSCLSCQEVKPS